MLLILVGRLAQFFLLFATIKISTTLLSPAEMAKVYLMASLFSFFALIFINPVGMFINRRIHSWNHAGRVQEYLNYFWLYLVSISLFAYFLLELLFKFKLFQLQSETGYISALVVGTLLFATINQSVIPGLNLLGFREWFVGLTIATTAVGVVVAVLLIYLFKPIAEFWQSGILIGYALVAVLGWRVFYRKVSTRSIAPRPASPHLIVILKFSLPIAVAVGLGWIQTQSYRFIMESIIGLHALGLFAAGYGISAGIISAFESVFTTYLQPIFYKNISNDNVTEQSKAWSEYAGTIFPSLMLVGFVVLATAPELTRAMLGSEYVSSSQYIVWGVIAELARVASGIYGMIAHARMKTRLLLFPSFAGASLSIALIWWLMPIYASNGVGAALMASSVTVFVLTYAATHKEYETTFPHGMFIASIVMGAGLILLAEILRWMMGNNGSFVVIAIQLFVVGIFFMAGQYFLLRPILKGERAHE